MKLFSEFEAGANAITAASLGRDAAFIAVGGVRYTRSLLILPNRIDATWGPDHISHLHESHLETLAQSGIALVLLGTGIRQTFPPPALLRAIIAAQIGVEIMDTAAACRTHNILIAEGRKFASALIIERQIA